MPYREDADLAWRGLDGRAGRFERAALDSGQAGGEANRGGVGIDIAGHRDREVLAADQPRVVRAYSIGREFGDGVRAAQQRLAIRMTLEMSFDEEQERQLCQVVLAALDRGQCVLALALELLGIERGLEQQLGE